MITLLSYLLLSASHAAVPASYDCELLVIASDLKDGSVKIHFSAPVEGAGIHGGDQGEYTVEKHKIITMSDGKWLGIQWLRNSVLVGKAITLRGDVDQTGQVLIVYNPQNGDEQVSVNCEAKH